MARRRPAAKGKIPRWTLDEINAMLPPGVRLAVAPGGVRLELIEPSTATPIVDQYGVIYTKRPPRSQFSYEPDRRDGPPTVITDDVTAEVKRLRGTGQTERAIEKILRARGKKISRATLRQIPRPQ